MKMNYKIKFYIPLIIAVAMLLAVTLPVLGLPYCYSETQLLGDSIFFLKNSGIGLVFNHDTVELPDLFSLVFSLFARFVSCKPIVLHLFAMVFPALAIVAAYKFGKFFFSVQAGVIAASIMVVQNVFLAQSGLVLPIMMLNVCILGGLYFFFRERYGLCVVLMCAATLTDIIGLAASVYLLVSYFRIKYREWTMNNSLLMALPIALWLVYQFVSLEVCGRFSIRHLDFSLQNFVENAWFVFIAQHRWAMTAVLVAVLAVNIVNKNMLYFVKEMAWKGTAMFVLMFVTNSVMSPVQSWNLVPISIFAVFTGCAISTLHTSYYSKYIVACAIIAVSALGVTQRKSVSDAYVNYKSKVKVDKKTVELVVKKYDENTCILCDKYFAKYLTNKNFGYVDGAMLYDCIPPSETTKIPQIAIYSSFAPDARLILLRDDVAYEKKHTIYIGEYEDEILQKK